MATAISRVSFQLVIFATLVLSLSDFSSGEEQLGTNGVSESSKRSRNSAFGSITRRSLLECKDPNPLLNLTIDAADHSLQNVQTVVVTVSGVLRPSSQDWIGVFSQATHNYSDCPTNGALYAETGDFSSLPLLCDYPLKFKFLGEDPGYLNCSKRTCVGNSTTCSIATCSGSLSFRIINVRTDISFVLFGGGLATPCVLKISKSLAFANPAAPLYGHLSLANSIGTTMVLTWISNINDTQYVEYSGRRSSSRRITFQREDMCDGLPGPARDFGWHTPGFIHEATMTGFSPGKTYSYKYGSGKVGWSRIKSFTTPPAEGSNSVKFGIFGDMGKFDRDNSSEHYIQPGALQVIDSVAKETLDVLFHIGDISYATGFLAEWDQFLEMIEPVASKVPYMTAIGNHERDFPGSGSAYELFDSGGECGVPYQSYFRMPVQGVDKPWYSISVGPVHFTVISTEHDWTKNSEQYAWMLRDLASVNRSRTPWVVFTGHRPMYSTDRDGIISKLMPGVDPNFVKAVEPLLIKSRVDLAVWGHVHNYERSCAVNKGRCMQMPTKDKSGIDVYKSKVAPVHVVIGTGGFSLDPFPTNWSSWSLVRKSAFGYGRVSADKKELLFEYVTAGAPADRFKIVS